MTEFQPGDLVEVKKGGKRYTGILMPRSELADDRHVVIKLDSGYNIGIGLEGADIMVISRKKDISPPAGEAEQAGSGKRVVLMGTGGTIASKIDYRTGAVHPSFSARELVQAVPELAGLAKLDCRLLFNILSENMEPDYWKRIAEECAQALNGGAEGVVIAHGTDTMGYTAAALSFMLEDLTKPVVLVGSQRSSDRPSSDSSGNLIAAVRVALSDLSGVYVVMHGTSSDSHCDIHLGTRVRKMHTSRRDAFKSINASPIGRVKEEVEFLQEHPRRREGKVRANTKLEDRVALFKIYPGVSGELFEALLDRYRGIVIEGTGLGHVPENLLPAIDKAREKGIPVVMTSQTLYGRVDMKVYSTGRELLKRGVISGQDMLPETAYVKLMYVLGQTDDYDKVKGLMETNLWGEISDRTVYHD
jgi:glutamyl-tRNA(Gln) amidotransferase subunit D